jgi:2'-5' RNA ligase
VGVRCFVAIELPGDARQRLAALMDALREESGIPKGIKWVAPSNLHLTLKFLGSTEESALPAITHALAQAASAHKGFNLALMGAGAFPSPRAKVIWAGVDAPETLALMAADVDSTMEPLGFERDARPFHAHITLGRVKDRLTEPEAVRLGKTIEAYAAHDAGTIAVGAVSLSRSDLQPSGPVYTCIQRSYLS